MTWAIWKWVIAVVLFGIAAWIVHKKAPKKVELGPHMARVASLCLVATAFYPLKEVLEHLDWLPFVTLEPLPMTAKVFLGVVFLGGLVFYLVSAWNSSDDEGLSALRVPALTVAVIFLVVGCGVLMWP